MSKQKTHDTSAVNKSDNEIIEINPFEIEKRIRKPLPPPSKLHKDKSKYTRKQKHKRNFGEND
ncbi:hypothetical protein GF391_00755 [Candidatus Uhrbacteria bacterium]|nr:hypothetical protein [Candidatus Uhrbacteria bacterium]